MKKVCDFIDGNLDDEFSLGQLSDVAASSKYHFHRIFKSFMGISAMQYVLLARMKRASFRLAFESEYVTVHLSPINTSNCCGNAEVTVHDNPFYRHQVHEIPKPTIDITEYRLYSGQCQHCNEVVRAEKPDNIPQGIMGSNLLSYIAVLAGQYHLSIRDCIQTAPLVHVDETSHPRNDEESLRWCWLVASEDLIYEKILFSRSMHSAKTVLGENDSGFVVSDQCPSLWLFLSDTSIPLTNNEAERRIRGCVIQRKISYGTTSDAGDKFRDRLHSLIETCKNVVCRPLPY